MEEFVRRLFADADFRREFLANPSGVIASSGLSRSEQDAAQRLSGNLAAAATAARPGTLSVEARTWD